MGCDIHIATEIKKDGVWKFVEDIPETLDSRNYSVFSVLANVRNDFSIKGFEPKGLPEDISAKKVNFIDEIENEKRIYETSMKKVIKLPDGSFLEKSDNSVWRKVDTREETENYEYYWTNDKGFMILDPSLVNGELIEILEYKNSMTFEEFLESRIENYDEDAQKYGYWKIDFDCEDYHSHSYLTLKELNDFDKKDYLSTKVKISNYFWEEFVKRGGTLPPGMTILKERNCGSIIDCLRESFNPTIIVNIEGTEDSSEAPLLKGILELQEIATKYDIKNQEDIRIVFAFDN